MLAVDNEYHRNGIPRFAKDKNEDGTILLRATDKNEPSMTSISRGSTSLSSEATSVHTFRDQRKSTISHWLLKYLRHDAKDDACEYGWVKWMQFSGRTDTNFVTLRDAVMRRSGTPLW